MNTIKAIWAFFFGFKGRISRLHYVVFLPIFMMISLFLAGVVSVTGRSLSRYFTTMSFVESLFVMVIFGGILAFILTVKYSHIVRRIHDFGKSAKDSGLFNLIIFTEVFSIILLFMNGDIRILLSLVSEVLGLFGIVALAFFKGTDGDNEFGSKPVPFWKK